MAACAYEIAAGLFLYGKIRVDMNFPVKLQTMTAATCGKGKLDAGTVCASGIKKNFRCRNCLCLWSRNYKDARTVCACGIDKLDSLPPVLVGEMVKVPMLLETMHLAWDLI